MNTTTTTAAAAVQANVTVTTVRAWCRSGVIAAVKAAGRWAIDTASLAHRIAIGAMRTRKANPVFLLTDDIDDYRGTVAVTGPAKELRAAFETGSPVTLSGPYAGERVFLGYTSRDSGGRVITTIGVDHESEDGTATYLISEDLDKLADAPRVLAAIEAVLDSALLHELKAAAADDAYLNGYYE